MSASKIFTVANLRYQLQLIIQITLLYSPTNAAQRFLQKLTPFKLFK